MRYTFKSPGARWRQKMTENRRNMQKGLAVEGTAVKGIFERNWRWMKAEK